jgi:hypothetical protein
VAVCCFFRQWPDELCQSVADYFQRRGFHVY